MALTGRRQQIRAGQTGGALNVTLDARHVWLDQRAHTMAHSTKQTSAQGVYRIAIVSPSRTETLERLK
jgi:hypothetical protein